MEWQTNRHKGSRWIWKIYPPCVGENFEIYTSEMAGNRIADRFFSSKIKKSIFKK